MLPFFSLDVFTKSQKVLPTLQFWRWAAFLLDFLNEAYIKHLVEKTSKKSAPSTNRRAAFFIYYRQGTLIDN